MKNATATRVTMSSIDESALELPVFEDFALGATRVGSRTRDARDVNSRITAEAFKERGNEAYRMKDYARVRARATRARATLRLCDFASGDVNGRH